MFMTFMTQFVLNPHHRSYSPTLYFVCSPKICLLGKGDLPTTCENNSSLSLEKSGLSERTVIRNLVVSVTVCVHRRVCQSGCTKLYRWSCKTGRETRNQIQTMKVSTKPACLPSSHRYTICSTRHKIQQPHAEHTHREPAIRTVAPTSTLRAIQTAFNTTSHRSSPLSRQGVMMSDTGANVFIPVHCLETHLVMTLCLLHL